MNRLKNRPVVFFIIYYLAYSSIYIARMNFSVASALFETAGILTKTQIGWIGSIFSFGYAITKIPGGYIGDQKPARKIIVCGLLITAVSNLLIGFMPAFYSIAILWGLNAIGQSLLWGPTLSTVNHYCSGEKGKLMKQLLSSSVAVGSILGLLVAGFCSSALGAAACFLIPGAITLLMALMIQVTAPDRQTPAESGNRPETTRAENPTAAQNVAPGKQSVLAFLGDRSFHEVIIPAVSHGMIKDNVNVWLAIYFVDTFGIDISSLVFYIFVIPLFGLIGRLLYPALYKLLKNDCLISGLAFGLCILLLIPLFSPAVTPVAAMLCLGMISAMVSAINVHLLSMFPSRYAGQGNVSLAASLMDVLTYGGAGLGSLFFGSLIQRWGYGSMFTVWGCVSAVSILCMVLAGRRQRSE